MKTNVESSLSLISSQRKTDSRGSPPPMRISHASEVEIVTTLSRKMHEIKNPHEIESKRVFTRFRTTFQNWLAETPPINIGIASNGSKARRPKKQLMDEESTLPRMMSHPFRSVRR